MTLEEQAAKAKLRESEDKARARVDAARKLQQEERDAHQRTVDAEAEKSRAELDEVLEALSKTEQRQVRLHAYLHVLNGDFAPNHLQSHVDGIALRVGRYMMGGKV